MRAAIAAALAAAVFTAAPAQAATRAYVLRGLAGWLLAPMTEISGALRDRGAIVTVGGWWQAGAFAIDACRHRNDAIVIVGHSLGAAWGAQLASTLHACGVRSVRLVAIDPPAVGVAVPRGVTATNFVGVLGGRVAGARNIAAPGYDHLSIVTDRGMQARIAAAALSH